MERRVERYFPRVLEISEEVFKSEISKGLEKTYRNAIATFGTMIVQNGILPALAYYERGDNSSSVDKKKIVDVIKLFLIEEDMLFKKYKEHKGSKELFVKLVKDVVKTESGFDRERLRIIEDKIIDISIALKLALSTYLKV